VIGGEFRRRLLKTPPGEGTRPTPDRLRESLFNIVAPRIEGAVVVDAFAGSGAVGIEALSRGAARAIFVERDRKAARLIQENLKSLGIENRAAVIQASAGGQLDKLRCDILFIDPPYAMSAEYDKVLSSLDPAPPLVIAQHSIHQKVPENYPGLKRVRQVKQGENVLSFYEPVA
jgi:16S rRNA (guanine(966)-N(2))-methyltransferase RsmD